MRKNKGGISLIVLVITIIIMVILAATIIISLNNTGIIGAAENAVCKTNIKQAQNLAVLTWSNIYTKPDEYTMDNIEEKLQEEFKKNGLKYEDYNIEVTKNGINVSSKAGCVDSSGVEGGSGNIGSDVVPTNWEYAYSYDNTTSTWTTITTNEGTQPTGDIIVRMYRNGNIEYGGATLDAFDMIVSGNGELDFSSLSDEDRILVPVIGIEGISQIPVECVTKNIEIQDGITAIAAECFTSNVHVFVETIKIPSTVKSIGDNAFHYLRSLKSVIIEEGLTTIGADAFSYCEVLENITIPEGVTTIGKEAFENCEALKTIELPTTLTSVGANAFYKCKLLESVTINGGITVIETQAFASCSSLKNIIIPEGVTTIKAQAFANCSSLENIVLPKTLENLEYEIFSYCDKLTHIYYRGTAEEWQAIPRVSNISTTITVEYEYKEN